MCITVLYTVPRSPKIQYGGWGWPLLARPGLDPGPLESLLITWPNVDNS